MRNKESQLNIIYIYPYIKKEEKTAIYPGRCTEDSVYPGIWSDYYSVCLHELTFCNSVGRYPVLCPPTSWMTME